MNREFYQAFLCDHSSHAHPEGSGGTFSGTHRQAAELGWRYLPVQLIYKSSDVEQWRFAWVCPEHVEFYQNGGAL